MVSPLRHTRVVYKKDINEIENDTIKTSDYMYFPKFSKIPFISGSFQEQTFLPLLSGLTAETAFLPLSPGNKYSLLASAVDFVGNRQPMDWNRAITVDFELQKREFCR